MSVTNLVRLPVKPLSVNKYLKGRKVMTDEAKAYKKLVMYRLPKRNMIKGNVAMEFVFFLVNHKTTDVTNLVKLLEDCLVKKGYIEDDRKVYISYQYKIPSDVDKVLINIEPVDKGLLDRIAKLG